MSIINVVNYIKSAGFSKVRGNWYITKHDIYDVQELAHVSEDSHIFDIAEE